MKTHAPVEKVFKMFARLLKYAQAFESDPVLPADVGLLAFSTSELSAGNPYKSYDPHNLLEIHLHNAYLAADGQSHKKFRKLRNKVLNLLEAQCTRMRAQAAKVWNLVENEQRHGVFASTP